MLRTCFAILVILSFLLGLMIGMAWLHTREHSDLVAFAHKGKLIRISVAESGVGVEVVSEWPAIQSIEWQTDMNRRGVLEYLGWQIFHQRSWPGMATITGTAELIHSELRSCMAISPFLPTCAVWIEWKLLMLAGFLLPGCELIRLLWIYRSRRQLLSRRRLGLCLHCGYDLRASSGVCPECGREVRQDQTIPGDRTKALFLRLMRSPITRGIALTASIGLVIWSGWWVMVWSMYRPFIAHDSDLVLYLLYFALSTAACKFLIASVMNPRRQPAPKFE